MEEKTVGQQFAVQHYSVSQVAKMWGLSDDAVRRLFQNEPDVFVLEDRRRGTGRTYRTLRIPVSVLERVYKRMTSAA